MIPYYSSSFGILSQQLDSGMKSLSWKDCVLCVDVLHWPSRAVYIESTIVHRLGGQDTSLDTYVNTSFTTLTTKYTLNKKKSALFNNTAGLTCFSDAADGTKEIVQENWLVLLFRELEKQGITLPERFTEDELRRFYIAANGDFSSVLSSVKKTIHWRETFHILTLQELDRWSHLVFWHGFDTMLRPCLVIRLGLACSSIPPHDRPRFGQAVVSQIDYGVVNLTNEEDSRITVLLDCHGISPFRFPMQMMRSFITVVQENYPNRLGVLFVVRLPPVVRVIAQTFLQVLKPSTKQKLRFEGDSYKKTLAEFLQVVPAFLGGKCSCPQCEKPRNSSAIQTGEGSKNQPRLVSVDDGSPVTDFDFDEEEEIPSPYSCENAIRAAIISLLMVCIFIAFLAGMNDPASVPPSA